MRVASPSTQLVKTDVFSLHPTLRTELLLESLDETSEQRVVGDSDDQADPPHPLRLLRARRERPRSRRAAEHRDEVAAPCMTGKEHCES
jgi:hypothetical protein